jgi:pyridoxine 5-phosphate synthase
MVAAMETKLSVNLNKVALLRNQRDVGYPSVLDAARLVVHAGAHGVTVHPRPDERHVRRTDVTELAALLESELPAGTEFNIEGFPTPDFVALIREVRPDQVTLVPDAPDQRTSDHGWEVKESFRSLQSAIRELKGTGARVSLFMDPEPGAIASAATVGADRIELYTGPYAHAFASGEASVLLRRYVQAGVRPGDPAARRGQHRPRDHRGRAPHRLPRRGRSLPAGAPAHPARLRPRAASPITTAPRTPPRAG